MSLKLSILFLLLLLYPTQIYQMNIQDLEKQVNIKTIKTGETWYGIKCTEGIWGYYVKGTNNIVICDDGKNYKIPVENSLEFKTNHELGHALWYNGLNTKQKTTYERLYKTSKSTNPFYRDYGKNNLDESFADDFALGSMKIDRWDMAENARKNYTQSVLKRTPINIFDFNKIPTSILQP